MQRDPSTNSEQTDSHGRLQSPETPEDIEPVNVSGRRPTKPNDGFGQLWSKSYSLAFRNSEVAAEDVIVTWKSQFDQFWPQGEIDSTSMVRCERAKLRR